jgi:hypothetical protein
VQYPNQKEVIRDFQEMVPDLNQPATLHFRGGFDLGIISGLNPSGKLIIKIQKV